MALTNQRSHGNFDGIGASQHPKKKKTKHHHSFFTSARMSHITEHPIRAKRRKIDDNAQSSEEVNFTSPAQLRELLVFQQNPATAKQGQSIAESNVQQK